MVISGMRRSSPVKKNTRSGVCLAESKIWVQKGTDVLFCLGRLEGSRRMYGRCFGASGMIERIHLIVKLLIDNYLIVNITCLQSDPGITDTKEDLATPHAWKPSPCTHLFIQLQPLHRHLLERL